MIVGIGVDTVDIARFERQLRRTHRLRPRLFSEAEGALPVQSLAARFAAKEALIKALGGSDGVGWHDMEVVRTADRQPRFADTPRLRARMAELGGNRILLSFTHEAGVATAFVIVEG